MEDGGSGCDEDLTLKRCADDVRVGPNETIIANNAAVLGCGSNNGVLHDNAIAANLDDPSVLSDDSSAIQNTCTGPYLYVSADSRVRCD
jgi:hypothetical protein